ncbi:MAG: hypothetical protein IJ313_00490 [Clostridia bacterium]|nr:hypothetical protein [Clostridia bacterium]
MTKKSERSLLLLCMVFAFCCLLLHGGGRLIGGEEEASMLPVRMMASVRAELSAAAMQRAQTVSPMRSGLNMQRMHAAPAPDHQHLTHTVSSDANGNVLLGRTYMRAVYQAFALDDGFV